MIEKDYTLYEEDIKDLSVCPECGGELHWITADLFNGVASHFFECPFCGVAGSVNSRIINVVYTTIEGEENEENN